VLEVLLVASEEEKARVKVVEAAQADLPDS